MQICISPDLVLSRPVPTVLSIILVLEPSLDPKRMLTIAADVHLPAPSLDLTERNLVMKKKQFSSVPLSASLSPEKSRRLEKIVNLSVAPSLPPPKTPT